MADTLPINVAQTIALFMECIFFGVYLVTFGMCMRVLLSKRTANAPFKYNMIAVAILMFIVATLDVALALRLNLEAFIYFQGPGGADAAFADISNWVNVMKTADYAAQTAIGDGMLLYRCYMVYNRRWIIIVIPAIIWAATTVCEAFTIEIEATLRQNAFLNVKNLTPFITSTLSLTLVFNIVTTSMIVLKIYSVNQDSAPLQSRSTYGSTTKATRLGRVMRIVIESGLMYTISVVIFFAVFLSDNNAEYAVADCVVQIIGIVFNLIIIRVDQGATSEFTSFSSRQTTSTFRSPYPIHLVGRKASQGLSGLTLPSSPTLKPYGRSTMPVEVNVSQTIDQQGATVSFDNHEAMELSDRVDGKPSSYDFGQV